jgi:hypothetical protein
LAIGLPLVHTSTTTPWISFNIWLTVVWLMAKGHPNTQVDLRRFLAFIGLRFSASSRSFSIHIVLMHGTFGPSYIQYKLTLLGKVYGTNYDSIAHTFGQSIWDKLWFHSSHFWAKYTGKLWWYWGIFWMHILVSMLSAPHYLNRISILNFVHHHLWPKLFTRTWVLIVIHISQVNYMLCFPKLFLCFCNGSFKLAHHPKLRAALHLF